MFCIWFRQLTHLLRPLTVCSGCSCTRSGCSSFAQLLTRRLRLLTSWLRLLSRQLRRLTLCQLRWARLLLCQPTTRFSAHCPAVPFPSSLAGAGQWLKRCTLEVLNQSHRCSWPHSPKIKRGNEHAIPGGGALYPSHHKNTSVNEHAVPQYGWIVPR